MRMSLSSYLGSFIYDTVSLTVANILKYIFFSQSTQNHEKHKHIEHFDGSVPLPILYLLTKNKQILNVES